MRRGGAVDINDLERSPMGDPDERRANHTGKMGLVSHFYET
jgi:hypothetical protein